MYNCIYFITYLFGVISVSNKILTIVLGSSVQLYLGFLKYMFFINSFTKYSFVFFLTFVKFIFFNFTFLGPLLAKDYLKYNLLYTFFVEKIFIRIV